MFSGGDSKNLGLVWPLAARSFEDFVERHLNIASVLNSTRAKFAKSDKETRNKLKRAPFVTPTYFGDEQTKRVFENAQTVSLVCLDIDDPKQARPYVQNEFLIDSMLGEFNYALYTTASSTDKSPRARVLVEADLDVDQYDEAVITIAQKLGIPDATPESYVVVQPMYLPILFADDDADLSHPLINFNIKGRKFDSDDIDPEAHRPERSRKKRKGKAGEFDDAIEFLKAPVETIGLKVAKEMLEKLDADMPYMDWLKVCLALRHQFYGKDEEAGFELFDAWSAGGSKYGGEKDTRAKWESCTPHAPSRYPVTIRTVMQMAEEAGWNSSKAVQDAIDECLDFINGIKTPRGILSEGLKKIALVPLLSPAEDDMLLNATHQCLKYMSYKVSIPALRAELKKVRKVMTFDRKDGKMPSWAKGLVYATSTNQFFRPQTGEKLAPDPLDNAYSRNLLPDGDESATRPDVRPRDFLLNVIKIPVVYDYAYDPGAPNDTIITRDKKRYVNTYIRSYPDPDYKRMDQAGELILEHTANLFREPEYQRIFLDWCAFQVQFPGSKIRWAPLIQGGHGCGKSFYHSLMQAVLGKGNAAEVSSKQLVESQFNEWAEGNQLVTFDEIRLSGHNRHEVMDRLKPLISNTEAPINEKFRNVREVPNVTNYMALTNHHDAAILSEEDRRWFVLKCSPQTKKQVIELTNKKGGFYFDELFKLTEKPMSAAARAWFEEYEISEDFDPNGHAPRTIYFKEMLASCQSGEEEFILDYVNNSRHQRIGPMAVCLKTLTAMLDLEDLNTNPRRIAAILSSMNFRKAGRYLHDGERSTWYISASVLSEDSNEVVQAISSGELTQAEAADLF